MKTPFGRECKYYYSDYARGRETEECRLLENSPNGERWFSALCQTCPVPDILMANQCPHMHLYGAVRRTMLGLSRRVEVEAFCDAYLVEVSEPRVGCGHCHEIQVAGSAGGEERE